MIRKFKINTLHTAIYAAMVSQALLVGHSAFGQTVEEIVITSTRRETNVQDVPIAVTALSGEMLEAQNIENPQDLTAVVPNVVIRGGNQGSSGAVINMRGIPGVGVYVDDVWQVSGSGLLQRQFVDLNRVEILRGPQGTLNGRDSTGGSIHLYTQLPDNEFNGSVNVGVGNFDRRDLSASVNLPLTDTLSSRWTLASYDKDGYIHSIVNGKNYGALNNDLFRGDLLWTPTDDFSARFIYSKDDQVQSTARVQTYIDHLVPNRALGWQVGLAEAYDIAAKAIGHPGFNSLATVSGYPGGRVGQWETTAVETTPDRTFLTQSTLQLRYDVSDEISVKYIYADTVNKGSRYVDYDGSEFNFFSEIDLENTKLKSHEIQINGEFDQFHWNVGYYNWDQTFNGRIAEWSMTDWTFSPPAGDMQLYDYANVIASSACSASPSDRGVVLPNNQWGLACSPAFAPNGGPQLLNGGTTPQDGTGNTGSDKGSQRGQSGDAFFGQLTYDINDRWDVTVGARYHDQYNDNYATTIAASKAAGTIELRPVVLDTEFADLNYALSAPIDPSSMTEASFNNTSLRFSTSYDIRDNVMIYVGYSEGFNSGGIVDYVEEPVVFNGVSYPENRVVSNFSPETLESWELGLRGDFLDGRLRANVTYFHTDWIDIQIAASVFDSRTGQALTETSRQNAADGLAKGLEFELTYAATEALTIGTNLGFLDTGYTALLPGTVQTLATEFGGAPDQTYNFFGTYDWNLKGGHSLMTRVEANYTGDFWRSDNPGYRQDAYGGPGKAGDYWKYNARAIFTPSSDAYELSFWINNITDEFTLNSGFVDNIWGFDFSGVDAPREMGMTMKMRF